MKKTSKFSFKNAHFICNLNWILCISFVSGLFSSCDSDNVSGESIYTFVGSTVASYCKKKSECSIFSKLMEDSGTDKLLACYGHYTGFIPTDSAFQVYFKEKQITYDSLTTKEKKKIVYDHIICDELTEYKSDYFEEGVLPTFNMSGNNMTISFEGFSEDNRIINVNKDAPILQKDIKVHNGVIHIVGKVIEPSEKFLLDIMKNESYFTLFSEAFELTHLNDSILKQYDLSYICPPDLIAPPSTGVGVCHYPKYKKYGYTIFAETDDVFKSAGISSITDLVTYAEEFYGTEDHGDYTSRNNALNKFISYHILDRAMATNSIMYHGNCTTKDYEDLKYEHYETFLKYRMIEFKSGNKINFQKNSSYVAIEEFKSNLQGLNGYVHALKNILVYNEDVMQNDILNKRIRFNGFSVPPQLTNNNIRWEYEHPNSATFTPDYCDEYLKFNAVTHPVIFKGDWVRAYQGDEFMMFGWYDFTLRLLPVPPGTYEIRFGYAVWPNRGIAQLYIDNKIVGIPVDLNISGDNPKVGWVKDSETDDDGVENDKMMRNLGYMKGPTSILVTSGTSTMRQDDRCIRVIVGQFTFQEYGYHTFRAKNVEAEDQCFHLDYIEYVPVSYLAKEGRD